MTTSCTNTDTVTMSRENLLSFLLILAAELSTLQVGSANHFYVKASHSSSNLTCPDNHYTCVTLEQLLANSSSLLPRGGNVTLLLLEGTFTMNTGFSGFQNLNFLAIESDSVLNQRAEIQFFRESYLPISNISTIKMRGIRISSIQSSTIKISGADNVVLHDVQMNKCIFRISPRAFSQMPVGDVRITLENCYFMRSSIRFGTDFNVAHMYLSIINSTFKEAINYAVLFDNHVCKDYFKALFVNLTELRITDLLSKDYKAILIKLCSVNLAGEIHISNSVIERNYRGVEIRADKKVQNLTMIIVNTTIRFHKSSAMGLRSLGEFTRIRVESCTLDSSEYGLIVVSKSFLNKAVNATMEVNIHDTTVSNNKEEGLFLYSILEYKMKVNVTDSAITSNRNTGTIIKANKTTIQHVNFQNTTFSSNKNGGLLILSQTDCQCSEVSVYNCTVKDNRLTSVANRAIGPQQSSAGVTVWFIQEKTHIYIDKVAFLRNHDLSTNPVIFQVVNSNQITVKNCEFVGNHGSSVQSYFSQITFAGHNVFKQNRALNGAALTLLHSRIVIPENSRMDFIENKAERAGGGIFIRGLPKSVNIEASERCFYQLPSVQSSKDLEVFNSSLNFYNNSAGVGGEDIYGSPLRHSCYVTDKRNVKGFKVARAGAFRFHTLPEGYHSSVTSDPQRVCLCDEFGTPQCANLSYIVQEQIRFPGEKFVLSAVLVGDEFGMLSGIVYGSLFKQSLHTLDKKYQSQEVSFKKCNPLEYSIQSTAHQETLVLTANKIAFDEYLDLERLEHIIEQHIGQNKREKLGVHQELLFQPILINITLKDCPVGFRLDTESHSCKCSSELLRIGIEECEITNHTGLIHRRGTFWITALPNETGIVAHVYCPYHYCKRESLPLDPTSPDAQCALNHSGILCGGCTVNYSLTIGSNRCVPCQNNNGLSLLLFFIAAGFLLVFFLKVLDLTVSKGTINGLVFYANVAWAYQSIIFPPNITEYPFLQFLHVFLAWLNLDFGIETCFVVGLTAYWKTWLQFVFPLYVWMIVGGMILLSRYSTRVTNALGNNTVPVLATLFLLSYAKLVRTIITVLGFSVLRYEGRIIHIVWSFDGNLKYFDVEHACLTLVALFAILLLWIPYVFTLIAVPYLKRKSHLRCLRWINSWKPFYDAYFGPLKDKHHYWIGLLLIVRGALLLSFSIASSSYPNLTILIMVLTSTLILLYASFVENVYKNRFVGFSENACLVNLTFLGSGTLYLNVFDAPKSVIVQISVTLACAQFIGTVAFHVWQKVKTRCCWRRSDRDLATRVQHRVVHDTSTEDPDHLREALLEDNFYSL